MPSERAKSSASKFVDELQRLRCRARPASSIASTPMNMYSSPRRFQYRKRPCCAAARRRGSRGSTLSDAAPLDLVADGEAVVRLDERDVVDDEHAGLADAPSSSPAARAETAVAAAVKRPGAAERAIPGAAAVISIDAPGSSTPMKYLRRRGSRSRAGMSAFRSLTSSGAGPSPARVTTPGSVCRRGAIVAGRLEEAGDDLFPFSLDDAVDRPLRVLEDLLRGERGAVAAHETNSARGRRRLRLLGQIDDLGDVGEVVHPESHRVRPPLVERAQVVARARRPGDRGGAPRARPAGPRPRTARRRAARGAGRSPCT